MHSTIARLGLCLISACALLLLNQKDSTSAVGHRTIVVLAAHGAPPSDFPEAEMGEFFSFDPHTAGASGEDAQTAALEARHRQLDTKMRTWPRNQTNDPFHAGTMELAALLQSQSRRPVIVGFNEYCWPSVEQALDSAILLGADSVLVVTPMMTRGGGHSETDIPASIGMVKMDHPEVAIRYIWPFDQAAVAAFLAAQIEAQPAQ